MDCDVITWDPLGEEVEPFQVLAADPRLATLTRELIGEFSAPGSLAMWSVGGGKGQAWHQDCPPDDPSQFNLNRLFYLQDTEVDDGAVVVVPGSHRMGRISPGAPQAPIPGEVMLTPRAGTLVLLHGHLYHRVTPNVSLRPRASVNLRAYPAMCPVSESACLPRRCAPGDHSKLPMVALTAMINVFMRNWLNGFMRNEAGPCLDEVRQVKRIGNQFRGQPKDLTGGLHSRGYHPKERQRKGNSEHHGNQMDANAA